MKKLFVNLWHWLKSIWFFGSNIARILENQKEIVKELDKINETIKSPQYQVAELETFKKTIELLKENNEQEKRKLERGSQEEIAQHKAKIDDLIEKNKVLSEYKELVSQMIEILKRKNLEVEQLNEQIRQLKQKVPPSLEEILSGNSEQPSFLGALSRALKSSKLGQRDT